LIGKKINMPTWKMPPKAKIYEALSAVADQRVTITGVTAAKVQSSSRDKIYDVEWSDDISEIISNDNASHWQGYIGYPIIAVLLKIGKLSFNIHIAELLAGVSWKVVNDHFKRDYYKAIHHILDQIEEKGGNRAAIVQEVEKIYEQLDSLGLQRIKRRRRPPKNK
jgi:hypothetical protein